jgi:hypothetical protein
MRGRAVVAMTVVTMGVMEVMEVMEVMVAEVAEVAEAMVKGRECEIFVPFDTAAYHTMQLTVP